MSIIAPNRETIKAEVPPKLAPLLEPKRYKGAYGGRGGAKSHFFAEQLVLRCFIQRTRAVCIREIQHSLRDSVRQLVIDKIQKFGLGGFFDVLEAEIRAPNGSIIIFRGMQSYNAETIKSLEAYDVAWAEEAQTLSQHSLDMLRPTIRKPGSELWFSWNPRHRTDPVDVFFRKRPHPEGMAIEVNWRDNPWFPDVLRKDMEHDKATDPELAEHIWEGAYGLMHGAILARLVDRAEKAGRINENVAYDSSGPGIEITSDIGWRDTASWWAWQRRVGGFGLLDYRGSSGMDADEWCEALNEWIADNGWKLGKIWLPHDARTKTFASKHSAVERFIRAFGPDKVGIVERTSKADRINAARYVLPKCEFHVRCEDGLNGLRAWEYEYNEETQAYSREPLHNWASHPSDAYSYGCQVMQGLAPPKEKAPSGRILQITTHGEEPPENQVTLDDLWAARRPKNRRI